MISMILSASLGFLLSERTSEVSRVIFITRNVEESQKNTFSFQFYEAAMPDCSVVGALASNGLDCLLSLRWDQQIYRKHFWMLFYTADPMYWTPMTWQYLGNYVAPDKLLYKKYDSLSWISSGKVLAISCCT